MPLFMDVHNHIPEGIGPEELAAGHAADLEVQGRFKVTHINYWVDLKAGRIFCLVEAPDAQAAHDCHLNAHGHVADEIFEVVQG
jgi:hypothetical protein